MGQRLALAFVFVYFFFGGLGHFFYFDFFTGIMPSGIVSPEMWVIVTGFFEILGAICVLLPATRRAAGWGLFLLTLCVTPANIHMLMNYDQFPQYAPALLGFRLVLQIVLLALILFATQPGPRSTAVAAQSA